ncbi:MAG: M20/M25/M40 family metallo-hydrolase [Opitutus sp.]|nr:M20/M25/M40 family metallo-hydrolase [Opitutus sp.]
MNRFLPGFVLLALVFFPAFAAPSPLQEKVRAWRIAHERELIDEYREFVGIPNITIDRANIRRNADFIVGLLKRRGVEARLLTLPSPNPNPVVYGEVKVPGATRTIMFYAHYDGQPVNPAQWAPGWEPFTPKFATAPVEQGGKIIEGWKSGDRVDPQWRLTGRGSADDKAGGMTIVTAYAALAASGAAPTANLKFFFDGEEELNSPSLPDLIAANRELLRADLWLILDGPCHPSGKKIVGFGVRGDVNLQLTVFGPKRPLHSGNYGNWAPNPSQALVNLLASMKDDDGRVLVAGFFDDVIPLTPAEQRAVAAIPSIEDDLKRELGLASPEVPGRTLFEGFALPTLSINGIQGANVGALAANVIPTVARATLDLRLVPGNDAQRQVAKVVAHIKARGWHVLDRDPTDAERAQHARIIRIELKSTGTNAQRTPMDLPIARTVVVAVQSTVDYPVVELPSTGGTLPLITIELLLGPKLISVPTVNSDSNQHAENENLKIQFLWDGIETYAALMTMQ